MCPTKNARSTMRKSTVDLLQSLPDGELMLRIGQGGHEAFDTLYNRYARRLGGFFLRMLAYDSAKAEDMVQELFTNVWVHRKDYRPEQPFIPWIYAMAYNLCKNDYRHEVVRQAYEEECMARGEAADEPARQMEHDEMKRRLRIAIRSLPEVQRDVFLLHYDEELTVPEVAQITGCPEGTVKSRIYAALDTIRKIMNEYK